MVPPAQPLWRGYFSHYKPVILPPDSIRTSIHLQPVEKRMSSAEPFAKCWHCRTTDKPCSQLLECKCILARYCDKDCELKDQAKHKKSCDLHSKEYFDMRIRDNLELLFSLRNRHRATGKFSKSQRTFSRSECLRNGSTNDFANRSYFQQRFRSYKRYARRLPMDSQDVGCLP